jgi:DNA-binding response OmpR family regulator
MFRPDFRNGRNCYKVFPVGKTAHAKSDEGLQLLIVDDDPGIRDLLCRYLGEQGYKVAAVEDGQTMDAWLAENDAELVILDLMLPGEDEIDRIVGLEVGADDYLPKPFNPRELLARVRAVLRRNWPVTDAQDDVPGNFTFGPFRLALEKRALYRGNHEVDLSRAEFELMKVMADHPDRVLSRDFIMECLGGHDRDPFDRSIDVRVTRLRHKIEEDPAHPRYVRTVWGIGYQFTPKGDET